MYFDGQVEYAERLALENALDAYDHGATVVLRRPGRLADRRRGPLPGRRLARWVARSGPSVVVNVAGPWVDEVLGVHGGVR